jgi:hypothetical protein
MLCLSVSVTLHTNVAQGLPFSVILKLVVRYLVRLLERRLSPLRGLCLHNYTNRERLGHPCPSGVRNTIIMFEG